MRSVDEGRQNFNDSGNPRDLSVPMADWLRYTLIALLQESKKNYQKRQCGWRRKRKRSRRAKPVGVFHLKDEHKHLADQYHRFN